MVFYKLCMILILMVYLAFVQCQKGVCGRLSGGVKCCDDYKNINGKCTLCPKGYFGDNCNVPCPVGAFGRACRDTCTCRPGQICDSAVGCLKIMSTFAATRNGTEESVTHTTSGIAKTKIIKRSWETFWKYVYMGLAGYIVILICSSLCLISRKKRKKIITDRGIEVKPNQTEINLKELEVDSDFQVPLRNSVIVPSFVKGTHLYTDQNWSLTSIMVSTGYFPIQACTCHPYYAHYLPAPCYETGKSRPQSDSHQLTQSSLHQPAKDSEYAEISDCDSVYLEPCSSIAVSEI